jgi:hypothetical protein
MSQPLSFLVDRRSSNTTFYHFSERSSGESDRTGFSQQDSLVWELRKVYQSKFPNISEQFRNVLVNTLVSYVPLTHQNLTMLAAANFIIYDMKAKGLVLSFIPSGFASPMCESPQQNCISDSPSVVSCKQQSNSGLDQTNKNTFDAYFNFVAPFIMSDISTKTAEEMIQIRALHKITLLRYIIFVQDHLNAAVTTI